MNAETPIGRIVTIHQAKTHLSRLIARVEAGEEIILARGSTPVAKIVTLVPPRKARRVPGRLAHLVPPGSGDILSHGFWDALPEDELALWNGEGPEEEWEKSFSSTPKP